MLSIKFGEVIITSPKEANAITHNGVFRGYNVYSTVLLSMVFSQVRVARVETLNNIDIQPDTIVYDIGNICDTNNNMFDYNPYGDVRIRKKSFMLLWEKYGEEVLANIGIDKKYISDVFESFEHDFVDSIDFDYIGYDCEMTSAEVIYDFNPEWFDKFSFDEAFLRALKYAEVVMANALRKAIHSITQEDLTIQEDDFCDLRSEIMRLFDDSEYNKVIVTNPESANAITHGSTFGGIDVYSTALLSLVFSQVRVARVESLDGIEIHPDTIVYDIGGVYNPQENRYDHRDSRVNEWHCMTRIKTFGLLWKRYGEEILTLMQLDKKYIKDVYESIEHYLILAIDRDEVHSKHRYRNAMNASSEIADFNPPEDDIASSDEAFLKAVQHAEIVLKNVIRQAIGVATGPDAIEKEIEKSQNGILAPRFFYPLQWEVHSGTRNPKRDEIFFIVYPYVTGDWWVDTTRAAWDKQVEFPREWEGKRGEEFAKITGVADATYCDDMRLHCRAKTREGAMRLAELAMKANNK